MTEKSAPADHGSAGWPDERCVGSGTGVVMPTLIPLATELSGTLGMSALSLVIGVIVGTNGVVISPLSTVGSICVRLRARVS